MRNYLAAEEISSGHKPGGLVDRLRGLVQRMENITKELKFFSVRGGSTTEDIVIRDLVDGAIGLVKHDLAQQHIRTDIHLASELPNVKGNKQRLEQVLVNLFRNAISAMRDSEKKNNSISPQLLIKSTSQLPCETGATGLAVNLSSSYRNRFTPTNPQAKAWALAWPYQLPLCASIKDC